MRASAIMAVAVLMYVIVRWERNESAVTLDAVVGGLFAIIVIALLDQGKTESIAKGFAWLFFVVAAYNAIPALANVSSSAKKSATSVPAQIA